MRKLANIVLLCTLLLPGMAQAWWNDDWSFRTRVTVDPSRAALRASGSEAQVPVLLRLHDGNFNFLDARADGTDLRFIADDDVTPLDYHVESFDGVTGIAYIWVKLPQLSTAEAQQVWLYYGNDAAASVANAPATYDAETALVYHFNESVGTPRDQSANGNNATASDATPTFESLIHQGLSLNGNMQVRTPAAPSLGLRPDGAYTWSAWVKTESERPQALASLFTLLGETGDSMPERMVVGLQQNRPFLQLVDGAGQVQQVLAPGQVQSNAWVHLAAVIAEGTARLYVNGAEVAGQSVTVPALNGDAVVGAVTVTESVVAPATAPAETDTETAARGFIGKLDEMMVATTARSPAWLALVASSQGRESAISEISAQPEARGSWLGGGYFGVLLGAVTFDGWVVIFLLGIMLVVSMAVIYTRMTYVRRVGQGNQLFLAQFDSLVAQMRGSRLSGGGFPEPEGVDAIAHSPIYRLYAIGGSEIQQRLNQGAHGLDPLSVETLKATLESTLVREQLSLGKQMVYLTIAISGGPFLGLLGTVVGVMITFAAIAAAGDVNVNAIAPGIAAALMATVAGLAVAIPALFAYNYLTSRIRELTVEMQIFVNELVAKVSEIYAHP